MRENLDRAMQHVLKEEGGFVNHKLDPGGMTNLGVTARVWEEWVGHPVDEKQMRALVAADVIPLYQRKYWNATRCSDLPSGLDLCVFDTALTQAQGEPLSYCRDVLALLLTVLLAITLSLL